MESGVLWRETLTCKNPKCPSAACWMFLCKCEVAVGSHALWWLWTVASVLNLWPFFPDSYTLTWAQGNPAWAQSCFIYYCWARLSLFLWKAFLKGNCVQWVVRNPIFPITCTIYPLNLKDLLKWKSCEILFETWNFLPVVHKKLFSRLRME